ncbi:MAG: Fe-S-cluster-containing hydrogenase component 2 [Arenicella sp.]|jgi:Fe-S-cluster-containing hydrogenase component 2
MGELIYEIEASKCTECIGHFKKEQCIIVCPVDCILVDPEHQESQTTLQQKYQQLTGKDYDPAIEIA